MIYRNVSLSIICFLLIVMIGQMSSQPCSQMNISLQSEIGSQCQTIAMTMKSDRLGRSYLYIAQKEGGLNIYSTSTITAPKFVANLSRSALGGLDVMSLTQDGNYLFLALGNSFADGQAPGLAIVDISDATKPIVASTWKQATGTRGAGFVAVENNRAYLAAMQSGLIVFDITNKNSIHEILRVKPDLAFPDTKYDSAKINARGMEVRNGIVYLCYDAGGFRIIDCNGLDQPRELGRFANPKLNGHPRAYNNIVIDDSLAYIAVDYCGLEILNIKNPQAISLVSWWNPWSCELNSLNWFSSNGHANEVALRKDCKKLFLSTGKSDMMVVDVSDPTHPDSCSTYGGINNNLGTWGIDVDQNNIYLSYICAIIPFSSNWTGVKILSYNSCTSSAVAIQQPDENEVRAVITNNTLSIHSDQELRPENLCVVDLLGRNIVKSIQRVDNHQLFIELNYAPLLCYVQIVGSSSKAQLVLARE